MHATSKPIIVERGVRYRDTDKTALIPIKNVVTECEVLLRRPEWVKIKLPADSIRIQGIKVAMRKNGLHSVCEETSCSNLTECFNHDIAMFVILGTIYTRRCPFCDIAHGHPVVPDADGPVRLAQTITDMAPRYVVATSADYNDLHDGDVQHFTDCIIAIQKKSPQIKIETLAPDFRDRMDHALDILTVTPPDAFNHSLENIPRIYHQVWPGANYSWSLKLLERFREAHPETPIESGPMVGLGETNEETIKVMHGLRYHGVTMLTLEQYSQPSHHHLPVQRHVSPDEFDEMKTEALAISSTHTACGPLVRFSYHADLQTKGTEVKQSCNNYLRLSNKKPAL